MENFLETLPTSVRGIFRRALSGKSKAAAIKAKCLDCCCMNKEEIRLCTVSNCSLYTYRPYQKAVKKDK